MVEFPFAFPIFLHQPVEMRVSTKDEGDQKKISDVSISNHPLRSWNHTLPPRESFETTRKFHQLFFVSFRFGRWQGNQLCKFGRRERWRYKICTNWKEDGQPFFDGGTHLSCWGVMSPSMKQVPFYWRNPDLYKMYGYGLCKGNPPPKIAF